MCVCVCVYVCVCVCVCGALRYAPGVYLAGVLRTRSLASVLRTRFNDLGRPTNKGQVLQTEPVPKETRQEATKKNPHVATLTEYRSPTPR